MANLTLKVLQVVCRVQEVFLLLTNDIHTFNSTASMVRWMQWSSGYHIGLQRGVAGLGSIPQSVCWPTFPCHHPPPSPIGLIITLYQKLESESIPK